MDPVATALYRRYRPEAFSEMIGQAHVTEPLMTALRTGRIGHAYLFSGPRGCGKTTSARILARCLNCAEGPTDTPCGTCPSCVELSREGGGSLDVVEIDAASHGGVDDARELRERAVFAPARDRFKIFIIDEAHMVTSGGFNALLKIVEEPPPHVKFIFATTEPEKVIGTIRSRTHHYPFRLIAPGTLIEYVQQLCDSEGVAVEPGVLPLVVRSGGGSVRDTLSILDQLIAGSEEARITQERATGLLGYTSAELLDEVIVALGAGDSAQAFGATDRVVQTGQDPRRFVEDLLERLRDLIVIGATSVEGASAVFRGVPADQLQRMFEQSQLFSPGQLSRIADTVSEALDHMSGATAPRLHLELMMARALITRAGDAATGRSAGAAAAQEAPRAAPQSTRQAPGAAPSPPAQPVARTAPAASGTPAASEGQPGVAPRNAPAPAAASQAAPAHPSEGVDVIAALKSAREFLNGGGEKAPMVPLGGHPPRTEASPAASDPASSDPGSADPAEAPQAQPARTPSDSADSEPGRSDPAPARSGETQVQGAEAGIEDLREVWADLLDELLEGDRDAWNAVKNVQPLALEGDILTVGVVSRSDLEAFKNTGAGPLREVIVAAIGVSVKYVPRQVSATTGPSGDAPQASPGSSEPRDSEPSPAADPTPSPAPAQVDEPSESAESSESTGPAQATGSAPKTGSAPAVEQMPAAYDEPSEDYEDAYGAEPTRQDPARPEPEPGETEPRESEPRETGPHESDPEPAASGRPLRVAFAAAGTVPEVAEERQESTRYGEAVVREVLGARFIEERPLPVSTERPLPQNEE